MREELGKIVVEHLSPVFIPKGYKYKIKKQRFGYSFEYSGRKAGRLQLISVDVFIFDGYSFRFVFYDEDFGSAINLNHFFGLDGIGLLCKDMYFSNAKEFEDWLLLYIPVVELFEREALDKGVAYLYEKSVDALREKGIEGLTHVYPRARETVSWKEVRAKEFQAFLEGFDNIGSSQVIENAENSVVADGADTSDTRDYSRILENTIIKRYVDKGYSLHCCKTAISNDYRLSYGNGNDGVKLVLSVITRKKEAVNLLTIYLNGYNLWYLLLLLGIKIWSCFAFVNAEELRDWIKLFEPYIDFFTQQMQRVDQTKLGKEVNWVLQRQHQLELRYVPWKASNEREFQLRARNFSTIVVKDPNELMIRWRSEEARSEQVGIT